MLLILIGPHSQLYTTKATVVNPLLARRIIISEPIKEVETEPLEVKLIQEQFSELLLSSNAIAKNLTSQLKKTVNKSSCYSDQLIFTPNENRNKGWLNINVISEQADKPTKQPYRGFGIEDLSLYDEQRSKKSIKVKFENASCLSDIQIDELKKYSFALYKYSKSGNDLMQERKHFKVDRYSTSAQLEPGEITLRPSEAFKNTVRKNFIDEEHAKDGAYYLLVFREDQISKEHEDLLLIY